MFARSYLNISLALCIYRFIPTNNSISSPLKPYLQNSNHPLFVFTNKHTFTFFFFLYLQHHTKQQLFADTKFLVGFYHSHVREQPNFMAPSPSELTLDFKLPPAHFNDLAAGDQKLEDFLSRLEDERLKIDAFKRELPLCMQLLTNALEASRQQLQACRSGISQGTRPVLEEFMPLIKNSTSENILDKSDDHKANWMTTAQLWSQGGNYEAAAKLPNPSKDTDIIGLSVGPDLGLDTKQRNIGSGAFLPFSNDRKCSSEALPDLALASSLNKDMVEDNKCCSETDQNGVSGRDGQTTNGSTSNQPNRKARRCWSPDLHRRFVNALQMLGGSQVATPKQIRELMKVDGLTNDEVKSHLQKYRLHTRRPSPIQQAGGAPAPQLVVLGGIWVPPEYATAAHGGGAALYGSHHHPAAAPHVPRHFCASQEFYTVAATPTLPAPPPSQLHHQFHNMYNPGSRVRGSPEPDVREAGDRSESIEDEKSESGSWKGESGGDQRVGLAALREEDEASNRSEIGLRI